MPTASTGSKTPLAAVHMLSEGGCDVVCGSRFLGTTSNVPRIRKIILKAAVGLANLTSGARMTDAHNGLRALSRKAACVPRPVAVGDGACVRDHQPAAGQHEMLIREVPVQIAYTEYSLAKGQSSLNSINILLDLVIGRFLK